MKQMKKLKIGLLLMMFGWAFWSILHPMGIISIAEIADGLDTMIAISLWSIIVILVIFWKDW